MTARARQRPGPARPKPQWPDATLLARLAQGEIGALGDLYDRHQAPVRRFIARATGDAADAPDLVHATFLAAAGSAGRYDGRESCRPWLMGIAVRLLQQRSRAASRFLAVASALRVVRPGADDSRARLAAKSDLERALLRLSEPKRVALLLTEVEGFSGPEVAELLGVPVGTVWTRLHAARKELRELLGADSSEGRP
jgi:RNA polymerase sigma-70 factor (ECF subfamily)